MKTVSHFLCLSCRTTTSHSCFSAMAQISVWRKYCYTSNGAGRHVLLGCFIGPWLCYYIAWRGVSSTAMLSTSTCSHSNFITYKVFHFRIYGYYSKINESNEVEYNDFLSDLLSFFRVFVAVLTIVYLLTLLILSIFLRI